MEVDSTTRSVVLIMKNVFCNEQDTVSRLSRKYIGGYHMHLVYNFKVVSNPSLLLMVAPSYVVLEAELL